MNFLGVTNLLELARSFHIAEEIDKLRRYSVAFSGIEWAMSLVMWLLLIVSVLGILMMLRRVFGIFKSTIDFAWQALSTAFMGLCGFVIIGLAYTAATTKLASKEYYSALYSIVTGNRTEIIEHVFNFIKKN
jgi:hypothetical protein